MSKVYIVVTEVVEFETFTSNVESVCSTEQKARERMRDAIEELCSEVKVNMEDYFEQDYDEEVFLRDEDDDSEVFKTFEDYWENWVKGYFVTPDHWKRSIDLSSKEVTLTYSVRLLEKEIEN